VANQSFPAEFIRDNLAIQCNVIHAAHRLGVQRLLFLGSSCIYPKLAPQPMRERDLLTGPLEPTNRPYALAKIAGIEMCWSYNRQYGTRYLAAMPTNLYGPGDNYHPTHSHVIPGAAAQVSPGQAAGRPHGHRLGHRHAAPRVSVQRRHGRRLRLPDEPARRSLHPAAGQRRKRQRPL
jgi:GDP-L-fucose synthase